MTVAERIFRHNSTHIRDLSDSIRSGSLAVMVGAGSSIACGYPSWSALLEKLRAALGAVHPDKLRALSRRDPRTQLDELSELLGARYAETFLAIFGPPPDRLEPPEWLRLIYDLPIRLLLTTNYTAELESVARTHPSSPLGDRPTPVRWHDSPAMTRALRRLDGRLRLIYFHGRYDDDPTLNYDAERRYWSRIVLGEKSYRFAYEVPGSLAKRLEAICQTMTLLTVGCSLADDDMTSALRCVRALSGPEYPPHYSILPLSGDADIDFVASEFQDRFGLVPIFYEAGQTVPERNAALEVLLREIVRISDPPPAVRKTLAQDTATSSARYPNPRVIHPLLRALDFEPRPVYRQAIEAFMRRVQGGVLALVGIGGAGKTALVRDSLDGILAGSVEPLSIGLFVWSFYDQPNVELFFRALAAYAGEPIVGAISESSGLDAVRRALNSSAGLAIVLDGLEKLQLEQPENAEIHGTIENNSLRELLMWLAEAPVASRALVTTRFPMPDLNFKEEDHDKDRVSIIDIDSLTRREARALLRRRGVKGADPLLDEVLDHFGTHALTVDHLGGVIANYLGGDAGRYRELASGALTRFETGQTSQKLVRVLAAYERYLSHREPEVRDTLQRVALFPRAVSTDLLERLFLSPRRKHIRAARAGALAGKNRSELESYLDRLVTLRFIRREAGRQGNVYSIHPAVRDAVLASMGADRRNVSAAAKDEMFENLDPVSNQPGTLLAADDQMDFVEDLIGFCIEDRDFDNADDLYRRRLGGYEHLGPGIGQFQRGERLSRLLGQVAPALSPSRVTGLANERSLFLLHLGRLSEATALLREVKQRGERGRRGEEIRLNLSEAEWLRGRIAASVEPLTSPMDPINECQREAFNARALLARGLTNEAIEAFNRSLEIQPGRFRFRVDLQGFYFEWALLALRHYQAAFKQAKASSEAHAALGWTISVRRSMLNQAEALRGLGKLGEARDVLQNVRDWAAQKNEKELIILSRLVSARIDLDAGNLHEGLDSASVGLQAARVNGFGLIAIELQVLIAKLALAGGDKEGAVKFAEAALKSATSDDCGYVLGARQANGVLIELGNLQPTSDDTSSAPTEAIVYERVPY